MNSIIRAASRLASRKVLDGAVFRKPVVNPYNIMLSKRWSSNQVLTYDFVRERILLLLRLFDKIDPEKMTLESHFVRDLGLDSLDHVEIIMEIENDFKFEIPDKDAEMLITPGHIVKYITDKEEAYEELQRLQALDHHGHGDHSHDDHGHDHHAQHGQVSAGSHHDNNSSHPQTRSFCSMATMAKRYMSKEGNEHNIEWGTSFRTHQKKKVNFEEIQERVMKVCSKYDKIDSSKLDLVSHFVQDLGLDSLDHVEIMMELEDEFGLEIPDKEAEKLMRPTEIARFIFKQEEKRSIEQIDRPY